MNSGKSLNFYMPIGCFKSASEDEPWIFEGIASTADVDLFGEVVYPESFSQTIDFFKTNGKIYFDHSYTKADDDWLGKYGFSKEEILSLKTPIGKPIDAQIKPDGLYIKGLLNKAHPIAKKLWEEFLANPDAEFGNQIGLSIGAKYLGNPRREYDVKSGKYITYLPELLLYEVSMTPEPVNPFTKTWASVIKSLTAEVEPPKTIHYKAAPESIDGSRITVRDEHGTTHVFELGEGAKKAMEENKHKLHPTEDERLEEAKDSLEDASGDTPQDTPQDTPTTVIAEAIAKVIADAASQAAAVEAPAEIPAEAQAEVLAEAQAEAQIETPADVLAERTPPEAPGASPTETPTETPAEVQAETPVEAPAETPASELGGLLDNLVGGGETPDASIQMLLDKMDTSIDLLLQLTDSLQVEQDEVPAEGQTTTLPPDVIKSAIQESMGLLTINLSEEALGQFRGVIKSALEEMEVRVAENVLNTLLSNPLVVKSAEISPKKSPKIIHPGASVTGAEESISMDVAKAVSDGGQVPYDKTVLKSLIDRYREIIGHTSAHAQQRARVVEEAQKALSISELQFRTFVKMADKHSPRRV